MKNRFLSKRYCKDIATPMGKAMDLTHSFDDLISAIEADIDACSIYFAEHSL